MSSGIFIIQSGVFARAIGTIHLRIKQIVSIEELLVDSPLLPVFVQVSLSCFCQSLSDLKTFFTGLEIARPCRRWGEACQRCLFLLKQQHHSTQEREFRVLRVLFQTLLLSLVPYLFYCKSSGFNLSGVLLYMIRYLVASLSILLACFGWKILLDLCDCVLSNA